MAKPLKSIGLINTVMIASYFLLAFTVLADDKDGNDILCEEKFYASDYESAFPSCSQAVKQDQV